MTIRDTRYALHDTPYTARAEAFSADDEYSLRHPLLPRQPPFSSFAISCRPPCAVPGRAPSAELRAASRVAFNPASPLIAGTAKIWRMRVHTRLSSQSCLIPIAAHRSRVASRLATRNPESRFQRCHRWGARVARRGGSVLIAEEAYVRGRPRPSTLTPMSTLAY